MRISFRAAHRLAVIGCVSAAAVLSQAAYSVAAAPPEKSLPDTTLLFVKINNASEMREGMGKTQIAQLINDPALANIKKGVKEKLDEADKQLKGKLGVTIGELLTLPQGTITVSIVGKNDPKLPIAVLISADAGKNAATMTDVMTKSTKQAEEAGTKVSTAEHKGLTLHILQSPGDGDKPNPPVVWTNAGSVFHVATDVDSLKDLINNAEGRSDSLASGESFTKVVTKLGDGQLFWFLDVNKAIKLMVKAGTAAQGGDAANAEAMLQNFGINGFKAVGGTMSFGTGPYDTISKTFLLVPAPVQGLLKLFSMPAASLRPEPWVPATVSNYQTMSWDLDGAYNAINDLVNKFQPGMLNLLEQQLVGPNGGEPLSFQKDFFGPLGDRITVISDYKKPITADSQRMLFSIALEDAKAAQATLGKILALANASPKKRDFQGTTIYDFPIPELPNQPANSPFKGGEVSLAIAKDYLFLTNATPLLEQVLRGGTQSLADSPAFLETTKGIPAKTSTFSFARAEEQARASYEMLKNGELEKALQQAGGPNAPKIKLSEVFDVNKLPDFSVFAKYLSNSAGYGVASEDGVLFTGYSLRKTNP